MSLVCEKATYEGKEGRDFSKSGWAPKHKGAISINENGESRQFTEKDYVDGKLTEEAKPWFQAFLKQFNNPNIDIKKYFAYKSGDEPELDDETRNYVKSTMEKVKEIVPVIRDCSLQEIANYGKKETTSTTDSNKKAKSKNVMEESIPDEMTGSPLAAASENAPKATQHAEGDDDEVNSILNS